MRFQSNLAPYWMLYLSDFHQYIIFLLLYSLNAANYLIFILVYDKILSTNATFRVNAYFEPQFSEYLILGIFEIVKYFDLVKLTLLTKNFTKSRFDCMMTFYFLFLLLAVNCCVKNLQWIWRTVENYFFFAATIFKIMQLK